MKRNITKLILCSLSPDTGGYLFDGWFDPIEANVRDRVRGFIQATIEGELDETLQRSRYGRPSAHTAAMLFWALLASGQINMRKLMAGEH